MELSEINPASLTYGSKSKPVIVEHQYKWTNRQCRGPCNAEVDSGIKSMANKVAKEYTKASHNLQLQEAV